MGSGSPLLRPRQQAGCFANNSATRRRPARCPTDRAVRAAPPKGNGRSARGGPAVVELRSGRRYWTLNWALVPGVVPQSYSCRSAPFERARTRDVQAAPRGDVLEGVHARGGHRHRGVAWRVLPLQSEPRPWCCCRAVAVRAQALVWFALMVMVQLLPLPAGRRPRRAAVGRVLLHAGAVGLAAVADVDGLAGRVLGNHAVGPRGGERRGLLPCRPSRRCRRAAVEPPLPVWPLVS